MDHFLLLQTSFFLNCLTSSCLRCLNHKTLFLCLAPICLQIELPVSVFLYLSQTVFEMHYCEQFLKIKNVSKYYRKSMYSAHWTRKMTQRSNTTHYMYITWCYDNFTVTFQVHFLTQVLKKTIHTMVLPLKKKWTRLLSVNRLACKWHRVSY
jgi:hypothetical protein